MKKIRLPAEWEEQSFVQLTWPHENSDWGPFLDQVEPVFLNVAKEIAKRQTLLIVADDDERIVSKLKRFGVNMENVKIVEVESNDTWARDHGGITVEKNGKPVIMDFVFNGWGLKFAADKDNLITQNLKKAGFFKKTKLKSVSFALEGGSVETDGCGTLLTTTECLLSQNRNKGMSQSKIEKKLKKYFGFERILWLEHGYLAGDDTDSHIDTLARFCDEETICYVACDDRDDEHYVELRLMEKELEKLKTADGKPYRLIALPMPEAKYDDEGNRLPATYANFLVINGAVLVPTYNDKSDVEALKLIGSAFKDRDIVPIDASALILWHGSIHCITMQYPKGVI
ncbi:MAG: agmatine/peptidylarginine deiminase [Campylobacterales bacterium]